MALSQARIASFFFQGLGQPRLTETESDISTFLTFFRTSGHQHSKKRHIQSKGLLDVKCFGEGMAGNPNLSWRVNIESHGHPPKQKTDKRIGTCGAEFGRGANADIEPTLTIRPPPFSVICPTCVHARMRACVCPCVRPSVWRSCVRHVCALRMAAAGPSAIICPTRSTSYAHTHSHVRGVCHLLECLAHYRL